MCGTHTRTLEELVFTADNDLIFWRGKLLHFGGSNDLDRRVFKYMFRRRGRLIPHTDLFDEFLSRSSSPDQYLRVIIRHLRMTIAEHGLPIEINNRHKEGYIMNVDARETP